MRLQLSYRGQEQCKIQASKSDVGKDQSMLRCHTVSIGKYILMFQRTVTPSSAMSLYIIWKYLSIDIAHPGRLASSGQEQSAVHLARSLK